MHIKSRLSAISSSKSLNPEIRVESDLNSWILNMNAKYKPRIKATTFNQLRNNRSDNAHQRVAHLTPLGNHHGKLLPNFCICWLWQDTHCVRLNNCQKLLPHLSFSCLFSIEVYAERPGSASKNGQAPKNRLSILKMLNLNLLENINWIVGYSLTCNFLNSVLPYIRKRFCHENAESVEQKCPKLYKN